MRYCAVHFSLFHLHSVHHSPACQCHEIASQGRRCCSISICCCNRVYLLYLSYRISINLLFFFLHNNVLVVFHFPPQLFSTKSIKFMFPQSATPRKRSAKDDAEEPPEKRVEHIVCMYVWTSILMHISLHTTEQRGLGGDEYCARARAPGRHTST